MNVWEKSLNFLKGDLTGAEFNTWILPLQAQEQGEELVLYAPNRFVKEWVEKHYSEQVQGLCEHVSEGRISKVVFDIGSARQDPSPESLRQRQEQRRPKNTITDPDSLHRSQKDGNLNPEFTFDTFVEGKSNQIARAASFQIGSNPGKAYNPLFIYGGVGLGKTHLMHAVGNMVLQTNPGSRVAYLHSERFVAEMVRALQHNTIDDFKKKYRSVNALMIDDVQFFAGKERSQEEFFHTFNALFESKQQIVLSSDRFPKEVAGLEERLRSRFGWGLTVAIEPPDLETRVAILQSKASAMGVERQMTWLFLLPSVCGRTSVS